MKQKLLAAWRWAVATVGLPVLIVSFVTGGYFIYATVRDWQTQHAIEQQNARIEDYTKRSEAAIVETNKYLAQFENDNKATKELLATITAMSDNIKRLAVSDQNVTIHVADLEKNYATKRNQTGGVAARPNVPLRQREDGALSADAKLYPH